MDCEITRWLAALDGCPNKDAAIEIGLHTGTLSAETAEKLRILLETKENEG